MISRNDWRFRAAAAVIGMSLLSIAAITTVDGPNQVKRQSLMNGVMVNAKAPTSSGGCGALGDGSTDDRAALQACIGALPAAGGTILFPAGVYAVGTPGLVIAKDNVTLMGVSGYTESGLCYPGSTPGACLGTSIIRAVGSWSGASSVIKFDGSGMTRTFINAPGLKDLDVDAANLASSVVILKQFNGALFTNLHLHDNVSSSGIDYSLKLLNGTGNAVGTCGNGGGRSIFSNIEIQSYRGGVGGIQLGDPVASLAGTGADVCSNFFNNIRVATSDRPGIHQVYFATTDSDFLNNVQLQGFGESKNITSIAVTSDTTASVTLAGGHGIPAGLSNEGVWIFRACSTAISGGLCTGTSIPGLNGTLTAAYVDSTHLNITGAYGLAGACPGNTCYATLMVGSAVEFTGSGGRFGFNVGMNNVLVCGGVHDGGASGYAHISGYNFGECNSNDPLSSRLSGPYINGISIDGGLHNMSVRTKLTIEPVGAYPNSLLDFKSTYGPGAKVPDFYRMIDFSNSPYTSFGYYALFLRPGAMIGTTSPDLTQQIPMLWQDALNYTNIAYPTTAGLLIPKVAATGVTAPMCIGTNGVVSSDPTTCLNPTAIVSNSADESLADTVNTVITFNQEALDIGATHDNSVNSSRVTVGTGEGGLWECVGTVKFSGSAAGIRIVTLTKNGSLVNNQTANPRSDGGNAVLSVTGFSQATVADYFELQAQQTSGGTLNALANYTQLVCRRVQ